MIVRGLLVAAGAGAGAVAYAIVARAPEFSRAGSGTAALVLLVATGAALVVAFLTWSGRRTVGNAIGFASVLWFVAEWDSPATSSPLVFTSGLVLGEALPVVLVFLVLAASTSAHARVDRALLAAVAIAGPGLLGHGAALFADARSSGCRSCAENLIVIRDDPDLAVGLTRIGLLLTSVVLVLVVVRSAWQFRSRRGRVALGVVLCADACLLLTAFSAALSVDDGFVGTGPTQHRLWVGQAITLCMVSAFVVRSRHRHVRRRRRLARVVTDLDTSDERRSVTEVLADLVGDETLEVAFPIDDGRYADRDGRVVLPIPPPADREATRLVSGGRLLAVVVHRPGALAQQGPLDDVIAAVALLLENEGLSARLRLQAADLRASQGRIVRATDATRRQLERDLHDGAQQRLVSVRMAAGVMQHRLGAGDRGSIERLNDATENLDRAIERLRDLSTWIHPPVLTERGLSAAVQALAERSHELLTVGAMAETRLAETVESAAYHLVAETARGGATHVSTSIDDDRLVVDLESTVAPAALTELVDRVGALGGHLVVHDGRDRPVRIVAEVPCGS